MNREKVEYYLKISKICIALFILITLIVWLLPMNRVDIYFNKTLHTQGFIGEKMQFITDIANPVIAILATLLIVVIFKPARNNSFWILLKMFGGIALAVVIKFLVHRARPDNQIITNSGFSYPSIHTVSAVILVCTLYELMNQQEKRNVGLIFFNIFWVSLVMTSRIALGNHYLTDTIGGVLLALAWVYMCNYYRLKKLDY